MERVLNCLELPLGVFLQTQQFHHWFQAQQFYQTYKVFTSIVDLVVKEGVNFFDPCERKKHLRNRIDAAQLLKILIFEPEGKSVARVTNEDLTGKDLNFLRRYQFLIRIARNRQHFLY